MMNQPKPWIVMTGASRGLGRAFADELRRAGYAVCALLREKAAENAQERVDASIVWDCALPWANNPGDALLTFCQKNQVVGFVHAAGLLGPMEAVPAPSHSEAWQRWWTEFDETCFVNHRAGAQLIHAVQPFLRPDSRADQALRPPFVMHLSSGAAVKAYAGWNAYCASKAAMLMEFKCLAARFTADELLVLSVAPGTVMTDMMKKVLSADAENFPALSKFQELEKSGGLVPAESAARMMSDWLLCSELSELTRWHGDLYDVRSKS